jgi:methionyl-tRNA formyltransferase
MLKREDGLVDWAQSASEIERRVRGFQPWPNAYTLYTGSRLIIWRASAQKADAIIAGDCGEVVKAEGDELWVACGDQTILRLLEVQPEGKRRLSARDFLNGARLRAGERLG